MFNSIHLGGGSRSRSRSIASPRARPSQSSRTRYNIRPASQMEYLNSRRGVKKYGDGFVTAPMLSVLPEEYIPPSRDYEPTDPNLEDCAKLVNMVQYAYRKGNYMAAAKFGLMLSSVCRAASDSIIDPLMKFKGPEIDVDLGLPDVDDGGVYDDWDDAYGGLEGMDEPPRIQPKINFTKKSKGKSKGNSKRPKIGNSTKKTKGIPKQSIPKPTKGKSQKNRHLFSN